MDDNSVYKDVFLEESTEYLQVLNEGMLRLEDDPADEEALGNIFRAAHTLKGMAATMGYDTMTELTHKLENILELYRTGKGTITPAIVSLVFSSLDSLSEILDRIRVDEEEPLDISELMEKLDRAAAQSSAMQAEEVRMEQEELDTNTKIMLEAQQEGYQTFEIEIQLEEGAAMIGARAYLIIKQLEKYGELIQSIPAPEELEQGNFDGHFKLLYLTKRSRQETWDEVESLSEIKTFTVKDARFEAEDATRENSCIDQKSETWDQKKTTAASGSKGASLGNSIRVDITKLDHFMNLVSELVIYRNQLEDISSNLRIDAINEPLTNVARISTDLQDLVLQIRMQPVSVVFNRFPRMVRDLSKELNKEMDFQIEGEETELDRTVVSELSEPLIHLIRNAVDHGIESVDERKRAGKPEKGKVKLSAYQEGNRVIITLSDDGKGLDPDRIKDAAMERGLNVEGLNENEINHLIFHQGFSTAKEVTNVSGRGVGMDVVRQKIGSLGGTIELVSEVGKGTTFIIKLPLTLSIIQSLMVKLSDDVFAVPLGLVEKVVKVVDGEVHDSVNGEVYMYRGKATPVVRVDQKLGIPATDGEKHLILVHLGDRYYGLLVDQLLGQQEIVIKKLSGVLGKMKEYLGATILGNGDITLILDVGNLCS